MSASGRHQKRDANHNEIVAALKAVGTKVIDLDPLKKTEPGIPDVLALWKGGFCFMEIKTPSGQLEESQVKWHAAYRGPPGTLAVVRTQQEALRARGIRC